MMKKRVVICCFSLFVWCIALMAQEVPAGVVAAFKKGDSRQLEPCLGDKVELILDDRLSLVDHRAATNRMATFFSGNKVNSFEVNHQGKRDESGFMVGTLVTANGKFRVNCFFRKIENRYVVHQIRIDKTNE